MRAGGGGGVRGGGGRGGGEAALFIELYWDFKFCSLECEPTERFVYIGIDNISLYRNSTGRDPPCTLN